MGFLYPRNILLYCIRFPTKMQDYEINKCLKYINVYMAKEITISGQIPLRRQDVSLSDLQPFSQ